MTVVGIDTSQILDIVKSAPANGTPQQALTTLNELIPPNGFLTNTILMNEYLALPHPDSPNYPQAVQEKALI